jgi:hypothetical protein
VKAIRLLAAAALALGAAASASAESITLEARRARVVDGSSLSDVPG